MGRLEGFPYGVRVAGNDSEVSAGGLIGRRDWPNLPVHARLHVTSLEACFGDLPWPRHQVPSRRA